MGIQVRGAKDLRAHHARGPAAGNYLRGKDAQREERYMAGGIFDFRDDFREHPLDQEEQAENVDY